MKTPLQRAASPLAFARNALQFRPDEVQARILASRERRILINCCRQWGKSTTTAALVAYTLWHLSGALVLLLAPTARQSAEIFRKVLGGDGPGARRDRGRDQGASQRHEGVGAGAGRGVSRP